MNRAPKEIPARKRETGILPQESICKTYKNSPRRYIEEFYKGTEGKDASSTMVFVGNAKAAEDKEIVNT